MLKTRLGSLLRLAIVPLMLSMTSCENNNLFSSISGESSDPATLMAQASIALRARNYAEALTIYQRVLDQDPYNSEALYGVASAKIGGSGLSFATLISNVLDQSSASSMGINGLGDIVAQGRERVTSSANCGGLNSIIAGIDCDALIAIMPSALCNLQVIISGLAYGLYSPTNTTLLIDLALLRVLYAALLAERADFIEINNDNGNFDIAAGPQLANMCTGATNNDTTKEIIRNVAWSYTLFNRVVTLKGLAASSIVAKITQDVREVGDEIMDNGGGILPTSCFDPGGAFNDLGINQSNYLTALQDGAFTAPSGTCN